MRVQGEHKVILESIPREKENARFSIVAYNPVFEVTFKDGVLYENGKAIDQDPFEYLDQVTVKGIKSDLPFAGGAIGFAGYDMIGLYEISVRFLKIRLGHLICISSSMSLI